MTGAGRLREVGEGASRRGRAVSGSGAGGGCARRWAKGAVAVAGECWADAACWAERPRRAAGLAQERERGKSERAVGKKGPRAEMKKGRRRKDFFFPNKIFQIHFQMIFFLILIQILVKVSHYKNKCAAA